MALMLCFPNCKINLGLYITSKRRDGYHDLATVFYPLPLTDALEIVPAETETRLHVSGLEVEGPSDKNLVWKACRLIHDQYPDKVTPVEIHLLKAIPMGAGLGGGSADGAFMLKLLNDYFGLNILAAELEQLALQLGSDCPFFIRNTPQYATGRGEVMTPVELDLSGYTMQLICPRVHVSTTAAFSMISPAVPLFDLAGLPSTPVSEWKTMLHNRFEDAVFSLHPSLRDIKNQLYTQGAVYASMSGSGSAIYGLFPKGNKAQISSNLPFEERIL